MAQTNYTPIILYNSGTTGNTPSTSNLASGELAINYTDGKLFYKDNSSTLQVIGWKTTPTTAGGTGLISYTAGDLPYYASGSALSKLGIGTNGYVLESNGSAPTWVAQSTLSVGTATNATNIAITDNTSSSATWYPTIVSATTGNLPQTTSSTKLSFVPSTGILSITGANLSGLTASSAVATDASKNLVSVTNTGTGNNVLATTPTITTPNISGNLTFTSSNAGIVFNNSSALTNSTLNDYETGTWTPTFGGTSIVYTAQQGNYIKIGNMVFIQGHLVISSGSPTNVINGLPFAGISSAPYNMSVSVFPNSTNAITFGVGQTALIGYINSSSINIEGYGSTLPATSVTISSTADIYFSAYYKATF